MSASLAVIPSNAFVPARIDAELRLRTLDGAANPLAGGGQLVRTIPGEASENFDLRSSTTSFTTAGALLTSVPSVGFVLSAPVGSKLLDLGLEVVDYGSGSEPRVEIQVTATGIAAAVARTLAFDPGRYTWRLSAVATIASDTLKLSFELVQEAVPTEFVDPQASTRLVLLDDGSGPQQAVIKPKRPVVTSEPTP